MDLITALQLGITSRSIFTTPASIPTQHIITLSEPREVENFVHKVKVHLEVTPVQQNLRLL